MADRPERGWSWRKSPGVSLKLFSILICTLKNRENYLARLVERLRPQTDASIEILINSHETDSIGRKRNVLIGHASGRYLAFIDDDDLVSNDYVARITSSLVEEPDVVGIEGVITFDGQDPRTFIHSLRYNSWFEADGVYYRNPNHLNPVRSALAKTIDIPDINYAEDREYSRLLLPLLKTEVYLERPIYFYEYRSVK
jgi:glycosyltransferase involved in cell wall biosynthesis